MNIRTTLVVIVIVIALGIGLYLISHPKIPTSTSSVSTTTTTTSTDFSITSQTITNNDDAKGYEVSAEYPIISGLDTVVDTNINATMKSVVSEDVDDFTAGVESDQNQGVMGGPGTSMLDISFATTSSVNQSILTFVVTQNFESAGAAHPGSQIDTYNFDTKTGKQIVLNDLLVGNYLNVLSDESRTLLTAQLGPDANTDDINQGTDPSDGDNFETFVPEADGLHIIFNIYQVADYADGSQEIVIPYAHLQSVINPAGLLSETVK